MDWQCERCPLDSSLWMALDGFWRSHIGASMKTRTFPGVEKQGVLDSIRPVAGLVDEIPMDVAPVLFSEEVRLCDHRGSKRIDRSETEGSADDEAAHLTWRA